MTVSPDQFQRRVRVRLPFADRYLAGKDAAKAAQRDLERAFARPLLQVAIAPGPAAPDAPACRLPSPPAFMSAADGDGASATPPRPPGPPPAPPRPTPARAVPDLPGEPGRARRDHPWAPRRNPAGGPGSATRGAPANR